MDETCTTHKGRIVPTERKFTRSCGDGKSSSPLISASRCLTASVAAQNGGESAQQSPPQDMLPNNISSTTPTGDVGSSAKLRKPHRELLREISLARYQFAWIAAPC